MCAHSCDYLDPALAWTGVKNSGRGVSLSKFGECRLGLFGERVGDEEFGLGLTDDVVVTRLRPADESEIGAYEDQDVAVKWVKLETGVSMMSRRQILLCARVYKNMQQCKRYMMLYFSNLCAHQE